MSLRRRRIGSRPTPSTGSRGVILSLIPPLRDDRRHRRRGFGKKGRRGGRFRTTRDAHGFESRERPCFRTTPPPRRRLACGPSLSGPTPLRHPSLTALVITAVGRKVTAGDSRPKPDGHRNHLSAGHRAALGERCRRLGGHLHKRGGPHAARDRDDVFPLRGPAIPDFTPGRDRAGRPRA